MKNFSVKRLLITLLLVLLTAGTTGGSVWYIMGVVAEDEQEALNMKITQLEKRVESLFLGDEGNTDSEVTITTDKSVYTQDQIVKITITNSSGADVYYSGQGNNIWGLEVYKNIVWVDKYDYQVFPNTKLGSRCHLVLYERTEPIVLPKNIPLVTEWNQLICPIVGGSGPPQPSSIKRLDSGKYRLTFTYGQKISEKDPYDLSDDVKTVYSGVFIIK